MERRVNVWIEIRTIACLGLGAVILAMIALGGMQTSGRGDLLVSAATPSGMTMAVLVGAAIILGLELARVRNRRLSRARWAVACAAASVRPA